MDRECCFCHYGQSQVQEKECKTCGIEKVNWKPMDMLLCAKCLKYPDCDGKICLSGEWFEPNSELGITFPILNGLTPTVESCTMKVLEEVGELMQLIGKGQGKSGEPKSVMNLIWAVRSVEESLDTAQSAITMAVTLCKEFGIKIDEMTGKHEKKLRDKGYLK